MVRQEKASKVHEHRHPFSRSHGTSEHQAKDELVKHNMLDPPRYLQRTEYNRGKALNFGVLDWNQLEKWKDSTVEETGGACCSSASSYSSSAQTVGSSLELDLSTGVVKRLDLNLKPQAGTVHLSPNMRNDSFSLKSQEDSDATDADIVTRMDDKGKRHHLSLSMKQKEYQASPSKNLVEKEQSNNASELSSGISLSCSGNFSLQTNPGSETSSKLLSETSRTVECHDRGHDVEGKCSSHVNVMDKNQISKEKPCLLYQDIPTMTSEEGRDVSPMRRFSFSFSQMRRSFSSKESSSSAAALSSTYHASAKSSPLTFSGSVYANHSTRTKSNCDTRTRSGTVLKLKTEKNAPLQMAAKPSNRKPPTVEKKQSGSRLRALLQFTLRKGINLFQFVVENNHNVLAATMKSSDSSTRSYTLYSVNEVKNKSGNWLGLHRKEEKNHPFAHTIMGQMKTVTSFNSDLAIHKSESVLFGVETSEELAAIVQTRNTSHKQITTTIILSSGVHTLPNDGNKAPSSLIERWKSCGACDCGGWDIGCKLRVLSNDHKKSQSFSSFQLFDKERGEPAFKMVTHDNELHSVEFGSSISLLEAFFVSLAVSSHQNWCKEEEAVLITDGPSRFASNPPVSPIGRV